MLLKLINSLVANFKSSSSATTSSSNQKLADESVELGCRVAKFEERHEGDYFLIRDGLYELIDNDLFDLNAFQDGSRSVRGREHDLGEDDMFQIGQRKLEQLSFNGRLVFSKS